MVIDNCLGSEVERIQLSEAVEDWLAGLARQSSENTVQATFRGSEEACRAFQNDLTGSAKIWNSVRKRFTVHNTELIHLTRGRVPGWFLRVTFSQIATYLLLGLALDEIFLDGRLRSGLLSYA